MVESIGKMSLGQHRRNGTDGSASFNPDVLGCAASVFSSSVLRVVGGAVGWFLETFSLVC